MRTTLFLLAALTLMSASKCRNDASPLAGLETSGCFGFCPVFKLEVLNNGLVRYEGIQFVEKMGKDSFRLTSDELKQLKTKVKEVNLWQYPDLIKTAVMDAPFATLTAYDGDSIKNVRGSFDRPKPLRELEDLLTDRAEAHDFRVKQGVNPNEPPAATRKEVVVKLKPELNAGNWIAQFQEIRLRLLRRLGEENIWLVAYDPKEIDEKTLLDLLKDSDGVVEAQTNLPVKDRN